ncbi:MAG: hypothetical protein R2844_09045 [Caldilineales bacterium]
MDNGKPLTEIVASVDFDEVEMKQVYDPNSSLKLSMGLPPLETARGRIRPDHGRGRRREAHHTSQPASEHFYKAYDISYWTMPEADAVSWLNDQFGTDLGLESQSDAAPANAPKKIAFFVSDLSNVFHRNAVHRGTEHAKESMALMCLYLFDGKSRLGNHDPRQSMNLRSGHGCCHPPHLGL